MGPLLGRIVGAFGLLAAALFAAMVVFGEVPWDHWVGAAGALGITAWVYLDWEVLARFLGSRGGREQIVSWLLVVVMAGIALLVLHLAQRKPARWDFSEGDLHSLDPQTEAILNELPRDLEVQVLGFFDTPYDAAQETRQQRFDQLSEAARGIRPDVVFERINPNYDPVRTMRYGVSRSGTVVVTATPKPKPGEEPGSADRSRSEQLDNPDEQDIANALLRVQQDRARTIYFLSGHGELSPSTPSEQGLTALGGLLEGIGYRVDTWNSRTGQAVPEDADILVIAGPSVALESPEVDQLRQWVEAGGALLALVEPELDTAKDASKGLRGALLSWGLELGEDLVLDPVESDQGIPVLPLGRPDGFHAIVAEMPKQIPLALQTAQSVIVEESDAAQVRVVSLVLSSEHAWGETDFSSEEVSVDPATDHAGPVALAAVAEIHREGSEDEGRVVLVGDVDWITDARIAAGANGDFATRVFAHLGAQEDLVKLPPKDRSVTRMELSGIRLLLLILVAVLLAPGAYALTGVVLWGLRRNL